ncbi:MAG: energy transducer TonB [Bacteroidetes bacterium]|nr:energy transducer TonB [Bacteroidota bacterium]
MKILASVALSLLLVPAAFCQNQELSVKYYLEGSSALEGKRYTEAIELLGLSIAENPSAIAYFNRAVAHYYLGNSCEFCTDLKGAASLVDPRAVQLFSTHCIDTLIYPITDDTLKMQYPFIHHREVVVQRCPPDSTISFVFEINERSWKKKSADMIPGEMPDTTHKEVFTLVEEMPEFPGGPEMMFNFIGQNIHYPKEARENGIQGRVFVNFVVEYDGSVSSVKVLRGIGGGCDEEAARVIASMPRWKPGKQGGKAVAVMVNSPISFRLQTKNLKK